MPPWLPAPSMGCFISIGNFCSNNTIASDSTNTKLFITSIDGPQLGIRSSLRRIWETGGSDLCQRKASETIIVISLYKQQLLLFPEYVWSQLELHITDTNCLHISPFRGDAIVSACKKTGIWFVCLLFTICTVWKSTMTALYQLPFLVDVNFG